MRVCNGEGREGKEGKGRRGREGEGRGVLDVMGM